MCIDYPGTNLSGIYQKALTLRQSKMGMLVPTQAREDVEMICIPSRPLLSEAKKQKRSKRDKQGIFQGDTFHHFLKTHWFENLETVTNNFVPSA